MGRPAGRRLGMTEEGANVTCICTYLCPWARWLFAGAVEPFSCDLQVALNFICQGVHATHHTSCPPLSQCCRWQASLQYLVLHLLHLFLWSWASGAAQAAQVVRIILRFCGELLK